MIILLQERDCRRVGDTTVLDTVAGHRATFLAVSAFLNSSEESITIRAETGSPLYPRREILDAFCFKKTDGPILTEELPARVLQVSGRPPLLARYAAVFDFSASDADHRHPEQRFMGELDPASAMIIVEVDYPNEEPAS